MKTRHRYRKVLVPASMLILAAACGKSASSGRGDPGGAAGAQAGTSGTANGGTAANDAGAGNGGAGGASGADAGPLAACSGATPFFETKTQCRSHSDCAPTSECMHWAGPAHWPNGFGYGGTGCPATEETCALDSDCAAGTVCVEVNETYPPPASAFLAEPTVCLVRRECQPKCTPTSCAPAQTCDPNGHCFPSPCTAGFTCAEGTLCDLSRTDADAHGCAVATCTENGFTCPAGSHCIDLDPPPPPCYGHGPCPPRLNDAHGCVPDPCTVGFVCPDNHDCAPIPPGQSYPEAGDDGHGCKRRACTSDAQCDCGACIEGKCEDRIFVCRDDPPFSVPYPEGSTGTVEIGYSTRWAGKTNLGSGFWAGAQFYDQGLDGHLVGLDQLEGVDDCSFNTEIAPSGGLNNFYGIAEAWVVDGARQIPFDPVPAGAINFVVDLSALGVTPRFGGSYGFRAQGGDLAMPISIDGITLPPDLAIPELQALRTLGRGDQRLTWTGAGAGLLYVSMLFFPRFADSWATLYVAHCVLNDDGEFVLPGALLAQVPSDGYVDLSFKRESLAIVDSGGRKVAARGTANLQHTLAFGSRCDRPEVVAACAEHATAVRAEYESCGLPPPSDAETCPDYLVEACRACPEVFQCKTQNTRCEAGGLTHYGGCACP